MDGLDPGLFCQCHDACDVQIGADWALAFSNLVSLIGFEPMDAEAVLRRVNGHGSQAQIGGGPKDTNRNLRAIRSHQLREWPRPCRRCLLSLCWAHSQGASIWMRE